MADFEIIEADFQQYYHLDVSSLGFRRYARLLTNLPAESRCVNKWSPFKDWGWDREVQSQILRMLDLISCHIVNMNRKKGTKPLKVSDQFQPDYVKEAKEDVKKKKRVESAVQQEELAEIFEKRNKNVKKLEEKINGT